MVLRNSSFVVLETGAQKKEDICFFSGLFTGHDRSTRGLGQEAFEISWTGSGRVVVKLSRIGLGYRYSTQPDLTREI